LVVRQHINAGLTKCVVSYRSCQMWISRIMASSICSLLFKLFHSHRPALCWPRDWTIFVRKKQTRPAM